MWLITPFGFFSIVCKPGDKAAGRLTLRARVGTDLDQLRAHFLPDLGPTMSDAGTDYRFRASAPTTSVAAAMAELTASIDYSNFKNEVAKRQGKKRADYYSKVWSVLYPMQSDLALADAVPSAIPSAPKAGSYGGVIIDAAGRTLLREPRGHFDNYVWTFAKGKPDPGESPAEAALREVLEETGQPVRIVDLVPGRFAGGTGDTVFFLMEPAGPPGEFAWETASIRWAQEPEANSLIAQTGNAIGRKRDLAVLAAAFTLWRSRPKAR